MPRNASGVYSLPPTNPVVPFTTIATSWANPTLSDIADALTDSLDRTGKGGMTAPFRVFDGSLAQPGLAFLNEIGLGLYRPSTGIMTAVSSGGAVFSFQQGKSVSPIKLEHRGQDTFMNTGFKNFQMINEAGNLVWRASASIDAEDWNGATNLIFYSNGNFTVSKDFTAVGAITLNGVTTSNQINAAGIFVSGNLNVNTDFGVVGISYLNVVNADVYQTNVTSTGNPAGGIIDFNLTANWIITLTAPLIVTAINNLALGQMGRVLFNNTTNLVTWPTSVRWPGPTFAPPDLSVGNLKKAIIVFEYDGTNILGNVAVY